MTKAKSRLQASSEPTSAKKTAVVKPRHLRYWPLLMMGALSWVGLGLVITTISPQRVQHLIVPHLYLPVVALFWLGCFFTLAFLLLHTRRALVIALALTTFFFFQLQQFIFTWQLVGSILIFFGILELSLTLLSHSRAHSPSSPPHRANIKPQTDQPKGD